MSAERLCGCGARHDVHRGPEMQSEVNPFAEALDYLWGELTTQRAA